MDYILKETVTDIRYTANLKFTEKIGDSIRTGNFNINLVDTILSTNISINGSNFANYGITAPFTTKTKQIDDSLVNNGGIVVYLNNDYELNIIAIPMCICGDETIGFFSLNAEITLPAFGFTAKFLIKLCPTIVRNPVPEQLVESYEDPILPLRNDRVGKDYTPEYGINYPSTNIKYKTTDSLYVNTKTSGDHGFSAQSGFSAEILKPDYPRVPCYVNHLRVYTIPYEFEPLTTFRYDWSTVKSYLFDPISNKKEDIVYDVTDIITSPESTIVVSSNGNDYKATFQYYDVKQYIFKDADGYFKNKLIFEISQWSKEPVAKPLHLIIEVTGGLTPDGGRSEAWPMEDDVYILDKDNPTWYGLVEVKNRNKDYFTLKPTTTWNPEQHPYEELGPYEHDQHDYDYETLYYLSGISADKDGSVRTIDINSYLNVSDNPDYTWEQMKRYTNADNTIKVKYIKTKLKRLKIFRDPIVPDVLNYKNNKIDLKYTIENTDKDFYHSLDEYKTIIDEIIKAEWSHTNNLDYNVFDNPIISANDDYITITFSGINFSALNPGDVETNADINVSTWIADEDDASHISPDWNAAEVKEQTEITDYCSITYKKTKLNQLKISTTFSDNRTELDYKNPTTDISFTIENTDEGFYGDEYVTTFDRILNEQDWSDKLELPTPVATTADNKLILTYNDVSFSTINPGVMIDNMTTTAEGSIVSWIDDQDDQNHVSIEWNSYEVAQQTSADDNLGISYRKTPLLPLEINLVSAVPDDRKLAGNASGKLVYDVTNTDAGFYGTEYDTAILSRLQNALIETKLGDTFLTIPNPNIEKIADDKWRITYDGLTFNDNYNGAVGLQLSAAINDDEDISPDWSKDEVTYWTSAITTVSDIWAHNTDSINPFTITYMDYEPSAGTDHIHWLAKDRQGYPAIGSAHVVINNPNVNYRTYTADVYLACALPRSATMSTIDWTDYAANGNLSFDIFGVEVDKDNIETNANITAWGTFDVDGYTSGQVIERTTCNEESEWWKYKKTIPDIYPYDDFVKYSLYTLSDLEINGGKIGSKTVAARNVTATNKAILNCDMTLAAGCGIILNTSITVDGAISAQYMAINNSPVYINDTLYVSDYLNVTNDIVIPEAYLGANCNLTLGSNSRIDNQQVWTNPQFAELKEIPTATMITTGTEDMKNGAVFGDIHGTYTTAAYNRLDISNDAALGPQEVHFYPGKYYFNDISIVPQSTIYIHNGVSTEEQDNSVMIFVGNASFQDNITISESCLDPLAFRLYYAGTGSVEFGVATVNNYGTLIAPSGTISLRNKAKWNGHIWAQRVVLQQDAEIINDNIN